MPDYAESESDRVARGPVEWPLIEFGLEKMRHSPLVAGFCQKLKSTPSPLAAAVCIVLPTRVKGAA